MEEVSDTVNEVQEEPKKEINVGGAPTKYHDAVPSELVNFFERPFFEYDQEGNKMPSRLPTIERFCCDIDIVTSTFYEWCKKYPELSSAFKKAKQYQKDQLMQMSLMGIYKEGFAKFVAINCTDMKDKVETKAEVKTEIKLSYNLDD